ncbi:threonylcarbamoyl-AMP synthase [Tenacibaculum finnmarkense]|uniref:L-threonylcarbamoyladenylate synthase n=1 Tax=Tenacibaculum finnmarkense TaxID=2781243 RepID=UPI001E53FB57|nr:L-threonylcarbamoyladenylate synthase [Tenacibaculum finnmarkense]MCD8453859.1 threonylcarbamoyl-AMP synthase [Tenacibaculum finnmarkense genomovar ulcerans]MCG8804872.1 threonylcarbamoyl-AMP synthase [Tenacibaculum finnmarkense]MCG8856294.1 threonylcarbamoyl-AMP synthase [Tenacibaculum finnmarkense]MCM8905173.1 threonylcarbamoyl-AMP synthase [Tenacibaculum finnmarkense genomovar finnmarkense]
MKFQIKNSVAFLKTGKTILYPTDTVWGIGCDATNIEAVQKVYQLKNRAESKSLIILVDSVEMLKNYVEVLPKLAIQLIENAKKPTTIIYPNPKNLAKNTIASDNTIAIRIPKDDFCLQLIKAFGKPIVSTSANISGQPTPKTFSEISTAILQSVDYVVALQSDKKVVKSSTILKITATNEIEIIRE